MAAVLRPNPPMPSDEQLREWFHLAEEEAAVEDGTLGLRAVWRAGCDAGMTAPTSILSGSEEDR